MKKAPPMKGGKDFGPKEKGPLKNVDSTKGRAVPPKDKPGGTRDKFIEAKKAAAAKKRK